MHKGVLIAVLIGTLLSGTAEASGYTEFLQSLDEITDGAVIPVADEPQLAAHTLAMASQTVSTRNGGRYIWPAAGPLTSPFGWRIHPLFGNQRLHAGIDIGADYGASVIAADGGTVVYAGWIGGYGKTVIIEHNGTYSTLYGHNSALLVSQGALVRQGQVIARVGDTGVATGPVLHFEVRVNGEPHDPLGFLP